MQSENTQVAAFTAVVSGFDVLHRIYMRLISYVSPSAVRQTQFGPLMRCHSRDFVQRRIRFFGIFEHNLTYYTAKRLRSGDVYVDIGANVGYFTNLAAKLVGSRGKVIAVEAHPDTYACLLGNVRLNEFNNVTTFNVAATRERGQVVIQTGEARNAGSNHIALEGAGTPIPGWPLHEILGNDIGRARFIKVDIEGSEAPILDAILNRLDEFPRDLIVASEVSEGSAAFVARFLKAGFRVYGIHNPYTIDYYLVRAFLCRYGEEDTTAMRRVEAYDPRYTDYVFEREEILTHP